MREIFAEQNKFIASKTNIAVYWYDHLMISAIVLIARVFIVFNHAKKKKKKKYVKVFQKGRGKCLSFGR